MSRYTLLFLNGAILTVCAVFIYDARAWVLTGLMLFLPMFDRHWLNHHWQLSCRRVGIAHQLIGGRCPPYGRCLIWLALVSMGLALIWFNPQHISTAAMILLFTALPEEWFFRAYVLTRVEQLLADPSPTSPHKTLWLANITTSIFFTLIHLPTQGITGLLVLLPSLLFGWLYQVYRNILLVIFLHALSNLIFIIYIRDMLLIHL